MKSLLIFRSQHPPHDRKRVTGPVPLSGPDTGGGRLVQIQLLLLYHRFSHSAGNDRAAYHIFPSLLQALYPPVRFTRCFTECPCSG